MNNGPRANTDLKESSMPGTPAVVRVSDDSAAIESLVATLGSSMVPTRRVSIQMESTAHLSLPSASLLMNALRRYAEADLLDRLELPSAPAPARGVQGAIATYIQRITGAPDSEVESGFLFVPHVEKPSATSPDEFATFNYRFRSWLAHVFDGRERQLQWEVRDHITRYAYHTVQNIFDHAYRSPFERTADARVFSYINVCLRAAAPDIDLTQRYEAYCNEIPTLLSDRAVNFLEITVNDDGIGIPARQRQHPQIYWEPWATERDTLAEALSARGSSKLITGDTTVRGIPGSGTREMLAHLRALSAFARLRTGRCSVTLDGTRDADYCIDAAPLGYAPGTLWHAIIPLPDMR